MVRGYHAGDRSQITLGYDYAQNLLRSLPPGSRLLTLRDNETFLTAYLQLVEGVRPDVTLYNQAGALFQSSLAFRDLQKNHNRRIRFEMEILSGAPDRTFYCEPWMAGNLPGHALLPWGFVYHVVPQDGEMERYTRWDLFVYRWVYRATNLGDYMVKMIQDVYNRASRDHQSLTSSRRSAERLEAHLESSRRDLESSGEAGAGEGAALELARIYRSAGLEKRALEALRKGLAVEPDAAHLHLALAQALGGSKRGQEAEALLRRFLREHPRHPEVEAVREELARLTREAGP